METSSGECRHMELQRVLWRLHDAAGRFVREASQLLALGNNAAAVTPLCYAVSCRFHEQYLRDAQAPSSLLVRRAVAEVDRELRESSECRPEKTIIHANSPDTAYDALAKFRSGSEKRRLFWLGYFFAEQWANKEALEIFRRLSQETPEVKVLHWTGNLLSKLGCMEAALPFLEKAARLEPMRYNHHSHLGNVYRALHRASEAQSSYRTAIELIRNRPIGRVEHIHLVRCYHGLSQLGSREYRERVQEEIEAAVHSGEVAEGELARIMF